MPLRPVLVIGVGGSGGKTLRTLREVMLRRLRKAGWTQPRLPEAWQMLAIDTITDASPESYDAGMLPATQYVGLVPPAMNYPGIRRLLLQGIPPADRPTVAAGWLPETIPTTVSHGAGQNRAIGRAVAAAYLNNIQTRISRSHDVATSAQSGLELQEVGRILRASQVSANPFAIIVSSLSGGSGSGMFLDVIEALKSVDAKLAAESQIVLFGPDVFSPLVANRSGTQIAGNTLAAIGEIVAGGWSMNAATGTQTLYRRAGMANAAHHGAATGAGVGVGARSYYIVGATNADKTPIGQMDDAYRALGDSLSALIMDERVQDSWFAVFLVNIFQNSWQANVCGDTSGLMPVNNAQFTMPFASFGSARVSLGMDRLTDYATQRAARSTLEALLWPAFDQPRDGDTRTSPQKIVSRAQETLEEFRSDSGLAERDPANQVMDALLDSATGMRATEFATHVVENAGTNAGRGLPPEEWVSRLTAQFATIRDNEYKAHNDATLRNLARRWAEKREDHLARLLTVTSTRTGLLVAANLVKELRDECRFVGQQELPAQVASLEHKLSDLPTKLATCLSIGLRAIPARHPALDDARAWLERAFAFVEEAARARIAAALLLDMDENLLRPYHDALHNQQRALLSAVNAPETADGRPNLFRSFPRAGDPVPGRFTPGPTEFLLIPIAEQPQILDREISNSVPEGLRGQTQTRLIERVALCLPLDERGDGGGGEALPGEFFKSNTRWMPKDPELRWASMASPMASSVSIPLTVEWFVDAARDVLLDRTSAVGEFLGQSLGSYLQHADVAETQRRQQTFINALRGAFSAGKPLAETNDNLISELHPKAHPEVHHHVVSTIPLAAGSSLYSQVQNALTQIGVWDPNLSPAWFGETTAAQVDIFQAPSTSMSAMAFKTLTDTVSSVWHAASGSKDEREAFWEYKRARPLVEAIPIEQSILKRMVRGWVVAGLLNLRAVDWTDPERGPQVSICDDHGRVLAFPFPLLGRDIQPRHVMAGVLQSVLLAMVEAGASSSLDPFRAYQRLAELGASVTASHELSHWILEGKTRHMALPTPDPEKAGSATGTVESRKEAIMQTNDLTLDVIRQDFKAVQDPDDAADAPTPFVREIDWELRELVFEVYTELAQDIGGMRSISRINY